MGDHPVITDDPSMATGAEHPAKEVIALLQERIRRLEDAVALLQDSRQLEERVVERVADRLGRNQKSGTSDPAERILDAGRQLLPAAVSVFQAQAAAAEAQARTGRPSLREPWLLPDIYAEMRSMVRMYFDRGHRLTWQARLMPLLLVAAMFAWWFWCYSIGFLPELLKVILDKPITLLLAFSLYKVLSREARRYRQMTPQPPLTPRP